MIEFRILASPDKSQQSTYRHPGQQLTFGSGEADMVIDDPGVAPVQARVFWQGGGFFLENLEPQVEVRLNGRAISGPTPVKDRDNVNLGKTTVNFLTLNPQPLAPPPAYEHPQAAARFVDGNKEKAVLDVLEILAREAGAPATPAAPPKPPIPGNMPPLPPRKN